MFVFIINKTATTEIYTYLHTLPLHYALPIATKHLRKRHPIRHRHWACPERHYRRPAGRPHRSQGEALCVHHRAGQGRRVAPGNRGICRSTHGRNRAAYGATCIRPPGGAALRSEERRVGKEWVSKGRSR